ncbi:MAG: hypothetical protein EB127_27040, partial [Alphaproteobacteria bacterium]|nr:hypothetical protein [Alphaproteobacteria bacterium]
IVYSCLYANNFPNPDSNVITNLPLYNLATIIDTRILIVKVSLDSLITQPGNIFIVIDKHVYSFPSIASHNIMFEEGSLASYKTQQIQLYALRHAIPARCTKPRSLIEIFPSIHHWVVWNLQQRCLRMPYKESRI